MTREANLIDASFRAMLAGDETGYRRYLEELLRIAPHPKCVSKSGACPVKGCDVDGECYLWRCENPHAPSPREPFNCINGPECGWPGPCAYGCKTPRSES